MEAMVTTTVRIPETFSVKVPMTQDNKIRPVITTRHMTHARDKDLSHMTRAKDMIEDKATSLMSHARDRTGEIMQNNLLMKENVMINPLSKRKK